MDGFSVLGYKSIDNEKADELGWKDSGTPMFGPEPTVHMSKTMVRRRWSSGWKKITETCSQAECMT